MVISLRLSSDVLERVDEAVEASGYRFRDRSEFLRHAITEAVPAPNMLNLGKRLRGVTLPTSPTMLVMEIDGERVEYVAKGVPEKGKRAQPARYGGDRRKR